MARLAVGQLVTVYVDPITRCNVEGLAELVRHIGGDRWIVHFQCDEPGALVEREVLWG